MYELGTDCYGSRAYKNSFEFRYKTILYLICFHIFRKTAGDPSGTRKQKKRHREEIDGEDSQSMQKKMKKKHGVEMGDSKKHIVKVDDEKPNVEVKDTKKQSAEIDEGKTEVTVKQESAKRKDDAMIKKSDKLPNTETESRSSEIIQESNQTGLVRKKKKKKKKNNVNIDIVISSVDTPSSQTVRDSSEKTNVKRTKKKQKNKLPPISDDRLKAYGISVKKYKYCHSKKLMDELD